MNITVNTQTLATEIRLLNKIAPAKAALPVLTHILLRAEDQLYLAATDLQISLTTSCQAQINEVGLVALPAKKLLELLDQLPDADMTIATDKHHVRIACGSFKSRLQAWPAADFPTIPEVAGEAAVLPARSLRMMVERVVYAISDKTGKYVLNGALLSLLDEVFAMVSTDGRRLSIATASCDKSPSLSAVIPKKTLEALVGHCDGGKEVAFSFTDKHLFFQVGKRLLVSAMIADAFPKYERIIPRNTDKRATIDRVQLIAALKRVGSVSDENEAIVFNFAQGLLHLTTSSAGIGDADEDINISYDGDDSRFVLNASHVTDFLEHATQPSVTIDMKTDAPTLFTDGPDFINVVMGMRL